MIFPSTVALLAALVSVALGIAVVRRTGRSLGSGFFCAGMILLAGESAARALAAALAPSFGSQSWTHLLGHVAAALFPGCWLCFSLTYSRGEARLNLWRWWLPVAGSVVLPFTLLLGFSEDFVPPLSAAQPAWSHSTPLPWTAKTLHGVSLMTLVAVLANLEYTLQAAVGMVRVRVKFVILGLVVIFGARIYTLSEALLFSSYGRFLEEEVSAGSLLVGCLLMAIGYSRRGFSEVDLYPSKAVLQSSLTVLLVGGYLLVVGMLAQAVPLLGGAESFQAQALIVLAGIALLAVLLFSDRLRQRISQTVSRHFGRPQYDFRQIWSQAIEHTSSAPDHAVLCRKAGRLISETFEILTVNIWLFEEPQERLLLVFATSTPATEREIEGSGLRALAGRPELSQPFRLETARAEWIRSLREASAGHESICVPLCAAERLLGFVIVGDRVRGVPYTAEEIDLLKCLGDQLAGALLNLRLAQDLMQARELEAFQSMSAFFVHDLKNATASLNLMLQNFPVHFANPQFREEALRGLGQTSQRIQQLIARLSNLQHKLELKTAETDLNDVVLECFAALDRWPEVEVVRELRPLPKVLVDREQMGSVVTNLLLNAREAILARGCIQVETLLHDGRAVLSVSDTGCGMNAAFLRDSLFRPFQTTKKKGLGIGMYQSKVIVEAHGGCIQVASALGKGTTFRVSLPA